jgi:serine protease DegQ
VANTAQLLAAVAALPPRSEASIAVQRGNQALQLQLLVAQRPKPQAREVE